MKTVMKKMFSLLLVAALLVSAVPTAFADDANAVVCAREGCDFITQPATRQPDYDVAPTCTEDGKEGYYCKGGHKVYGAVIPALQHDYDNGVVTKEPTCVTYGTKTFTCKNDPSHTYTERVNAAPHTYGDATCTDPKICSVCGDESGAAQGHDWSDATCTAPKTCKTCKTTEGAALGHSFGADKVCTTCNFCDYCDVVITATNGHPVSCPNNEQYETTCDKCDTEYVTANGHPKCDVCDNVNATTSCHATADCPYCAVCWAKEDQVKAHKTADHCAKCGHTDGTHTVICSNRPDTGNAIVRVHVRLHNGTTLIDTVELLTYRDDKGTQIGDSVSAHKALIEAELAEEYPEYEWGGNLYDDPGDSQDYNEKIGTGTTVYINAYAGQDMVLVYVHNARSFNNLRIIQLEGKRRGDTVTKKEVTSAVSKYYNVSSLSMYSEDAWEDYVAGESVESVSSLKIPADDSYYVIDVKISGTAKSGSGSGSTADSSNPKTGDAIYAPVAVMGLSVSALAVLFYLNKKRAY